MRAPATVALVRAHPSAQKMFYDLHDMRYVRIVNPEMYARLTSLDAVRPRGGSTFRLGRQKDGDNINRLFFPLQ